MDASRALGLWRSTFGAVKIEPDSSRGGLEAGSLQGIWVYQRQGREVIGYFSGGLRGNVLQFHWQEPNDPPLTGEGFLVFDVQGRQYSGRWWSDKRDRVGDWNGWRQGAQGNRPPPRYVDTQSPYGGQGYGDQQPNPYRRSPYRPQAYPQQQYPQQQAYPPEQNPYQQPYPPEQNPYQQAPQPGPPYQRRQPYRPSQQQPPPPSQPSPVYY
jgi:hypothetical protein